VKPDGTQTTVGSGLNGPDGVAVDGSGDVFIADYGNNRVVEVKPDGTQTTVGSGLNGPDGVAVDGSGDVFIADSFNNRVVEVKPDGIQTTVASGLNLPSGVAVDGSGDVFIADTGNNRVVEVKADGTQTTVASGLNDPGGMAVDGSGDLFIADSLNKRVVEVKADGTQTIVTSGLLGPVGVAVDGSGDVFIADFLNLFVGRVVEVTAGIPVTVNPDPTSISLSATRTSLLYGQSETLTATVTTLSGANPTASDGTVSFYDGTTLLGTAPLAGSPPTATFTTAALAPGPHTITARYSGDSNFAASASGVESASAQSVVASGLSYLPGVAVDGSGDVFIADVGNNRVVEVKPDGTQTTVGSGLSYPEGVAVDGSGDVFIADTINNRVVEVHADGNQATVGSGLSYPDGVAVDGSGDVFIADTSNNRVVEVKPDGTQTTVGSGLNFPIGVAVDGSGDVFIADTDNNRVVEVKPDGTQATVASGLNYPSGVAVDGTGDVFIADHNNNRVVEVKPDGTQTTVGSGLYGPEGVAVDGWGDVFIADTLNKRVVELTAGVPVTVSQDPTSISVSAATAAPVYGQSETLTATVTTPSGDPTPTATDGTVSFYADGKLLGTATLAGSPPTATFTTTALALGPHTITARYSGDSDFAASSSGVEPASAQAVVPAAGLSSPFGVAVDGSGDVFIADAGNNRVVEVKPDGTQTTVASGLSGPTGVAVDGAGDVFIADYGHNRVVEVKPDGTQTTVGSGLSLPDGVAVDGSGDVFIADRGNDRVVEVKPDGTQTTVASGLNFPHDVAVDGSGDVFIADSYNNRVLEVKPDGTQTTVGSGLDFPSGVAVDGSGDVFIADDFNNRVVEVKPDGTQTTVGSGLSYPDGVAVDGSGDVFIADSGNNRVVEITPGVPVTFNPLTPANLQAVLATTTFVTLDAATSTDAQTMLTAVNGLAAQASPVTIIVNLASGSFTDLTASPPAGVTLVLNGNGTTTTIVGNSPALTVTPSQGSVVYENLTFTTATDAPTILVTGGSLKLRNVVIEESTGFTDAAISVTGGSVDLGTPSSPGGDILNVNGTGEFVHNTTGASIPATGDTFEINGVPIAAPYLSFTSLASSSTTSVYGQSVTLTATVRANTTPGSGTPTGSVDFFDVTTDTDLGSVPLSGGSAALTTAALGAGNHLIRASYSGDSNFTLSLDALTQTVNQAATATQVSSSADPAVPGQAVTFTATVTNASGTPATPAGSVQFTVDGVDLGSPVTLDASGHATSPPMSFPAGTNHTVNAFYVDPAANFVASDTTHSPLTQIVLGPGVSVYGTTLYLVGGSTSSDTASVKPAGAKNDGSTGLTVSATLNKVSTSKTFTQTFTAIVLAGYGGNETFTLASTLTLPTTVTAANGNDVIQLGGGDNTVALGDGNDKVSVVGGNNTVTVGNGNDTIQLGDGSNVVVEGNGNDSVSAGNGNNLIVGGLGRHTIRVGNGTNILIDGSATVVNSGDSFRRILNAWVAKPTVSNQGAIRSPFTVDYNVKYANTLTAGSGIDWFFYQPPTTSNKKSTDFLN
jgi:hypothetical protein